MEDIICIKKDFKSGDMSMEISKEISFFDMMFSLKLIMDNFQGMLNLFDEDLKKLMIASIEEAKKVKEEQSREQNKNLKVTEVAEILGISADSVRKGIIDGTLEFGRCIRMKKNVFVIPEERFKNWLKGDR